MKKPDYVFVVTVSPAFTVHSCAKKLAEESRGMMGFHAYRRCPDCKVIARNFEMWGENGHLQNQTTRHGQDRRQLAGYLRAMARRQWVMTTQPGKIMGYRFQLGSPLYYVGCPAADLPTATTNANPKAEE